MKTLFFVAAGLVLLLPFAAGAQEKTDPNQIVVGVAKLHLNSEYVSVRVDNAEYEDSFFEDEGLTLILDSMDRSKEHVLSLTPVSEELKPEIVKLLPKDWKLVKLDRETRQWQVEKTIKFAKWKPGEREKWLEEQKKLEEERIKKEMGDEATPPAEDKPTPPAEDKPTPPAEDKPTPPVPEKEGEGAAAPAAPAEPTVPPAEPAPTPDTGK